MAGMAPKRRKWRFNGGNGALPQYQAPGNIEKRDTQGIRPYALCVQGDGNCCPGEAYDGSGPDVVDMTKLVMNTRRRHTATSTGFQLNESKVLAVDNCNFVLH
eukprot:COSAG02_NODE_3448_length_6723_cov_6.379529_6_plen_103_part_00